MDRRDYITLTGSALLTTGLAGCSGETDTGAGSGSNGDAADTSAASGETTAATNSPTATDTEAATESQTPTPSTEAFGPETFSGEGTSSTDEFQLVNAPLTAEYTHDGEQNFQTTLIAMEGESYQDVYLTNAIGSVEGSKVANVTTTGPFTMDVQADGEWEITLEQTPNPEIQPLPVEASGSGPTYLGPFEFGGATQFQGSHDGEQNFIVQSVPLDSFGFGDIIFNEIGTVEEATTTARPGDIAYLNVEADGDWSLSTSE
ncbi:cell surface glycoprotein [Candidatus Halobonum tyrrellensis]|uniref:Cell surface glycoprotein n=1 Tax=Candidatus Halobonum tyrrellensis G22 TaxID=1324957 RepID=V4IX77_9EURY|nr:cell surface glycoprotein [Candidatus Halobonum tyrrellensis]ESP87777.1 cell surface glycoprotein [Candidatus Halobonum tyrrellensis G22]